MISDTYLVYCVCTVVVFFGGGGRTEIPPPLHLFPSNVMRLLHRLRSTWIKLHRFGGDGYIIYIMTIVYLFSEYTCMCLS